MNASFDNFETSLSARLLPAWLRTLSISASVPANFRRCAHSCLGLTLAVGMLGNSTTALAQFNGPPQYNGPVQFNRPSQFNGQPQFNGAVNRPIPQPGQIYPIAPGLPGIPGGAGRPVALTKSTVPSITTHQSLVQLASGHPVCVVIGEGLASHFIGTQTVDEGPFQDFVMGANVRGTQKTNARTLLDFTPDPDAARMLFVLKGVTANDTVAQLPQAAVHSAGTFQFEMTKQIEFNGQNIRTWSPSAFMTIRQQNLGASTAVSNVPLLGPLANNIVLNVADQRKPMSEGIAAQRVTQQVAPQFNSGLDKELAKLNEQLHGPLQNRMAQAGMLPSRISTSTTNDALLCGLDFQPSLAEAADASGIQRLSTRRRTPTILVTRHLIPGPGPSYGAEPEMVAPVPYSLDSKTLSDRACLLVHASLIESLAERFHVAGRELKDTQLSQWLGTSATGSPTKDAQLYTLLMAQEDPISAVVDNGELVVSVRLGIRPVVGPELPMQVIQIAVHPQLKADQIVLKPEVRSVEPLDPAAAGPLGTTGASMIRQAIEQRLKEFSFQRSFELSRQKDRPSFPVRIQSLTLVDGWITMTLEEPAQPRSADAEDVLGQNAELR